MQAIKSDEVAVTPRPHRLEASDGLAENIDARPEQHESSIKYAQGCVALYTDQGSNAKASRRPGAPWTVLVELRFSSAPHRNKSLLTAGKKAATLLRIVLAKPRNASHTRSKRKKKAVNSRDLLVLLRYIVSKLA